MKKKIIYDKPSNIDSILNKPEVKASIDYITFFRLPGQVEHTAPDGNVYAAAKYAETEGDFSELFLHKYDTEGATDGLIFRDKLRNKLTKLTTAYEAYEKHKYKWLEIGAKFMRWLNRRNENNLPAMEGHLFNSEIIDKVYAHNEEHGAFEHIEKPNLQKLLNDPENSNPLIQVKKITHVIAIIRALALTLPENNREDWERSMLKKLDYSFDDKDRWNYYAKRRSRNETKETFSLK